MLEQVRAGDLALLDVDSSASTCMPGAGSRNENGAAAAHVVRAQVEPSVMRRSGP